MTDDIFDFGFTAVTEQELEAVQVSKTELASASDSLAECQERLDKLYNAVLPLLSNLQANEEKAYIYWPDRTAKINAFRAHLETIYHGEK